MMEPTFVSVDALDNMGNFPISSRPSPLEETVIPNRPETKRADGFRTDVQSDNYRLNTYLKFKVIRIFGLEMVAMPDFSLFSVTPDGLCHCSGN